VHVQLETLRRTDATHASLSSEAPEAE